MTASPRVCPKTPGWSTHHHGGADRMQAISRTGCNAEWWDWKVYTANVTEQWAQVAVVGLKARVLLEAGRHGPVARGAALHGLGRGEIAGIPPPRLSHQLLGRASFGGGPRRSRAGTVAKLQEAGADLGITPTAPEAMHVMRAEKGFIMIGDETDGTVIPGPGLGWAISVKRPTISASARRTQLHGQPRPLAAGGAGSLDGQVLPMARWRWPRA